MLWDRQLSRDGIIGGAPREAKLLRRCKERGRKICKERGIWDVGVGGRWAGEKIGDGYREADMEERPREKKLRFVPIAEVIPSTPPTLDVKGKGRQRMSSLSNSNISSCSLRTSENWDMNGRNDNEDGDPRASSLGSYTGSLPRRMSADWVSKLEKEGEPVLFFGGGSWIRRVRNQSETRSGSLKDGGNGEARV